MNYSWNSNAHPISDIRDWNADKKLELRPDFQRKEVWTEAAKVMLIDTVLQDIPMPKIILEATIVDQRTYRKVIDGQQRIRAILSFLQDEFALETPYEGPYYQKKYSELDSEVQNKILQYKIDINEILNAPEEVIREMYSRVNKYNIPLNKQELRKADFPGKFLDISEKIAIDDFFEKSNIFTVANRRRMGDVEYSSELLSAFLEGIQDKKIKLDEFYQKYADLGEDKVNEIETEFKNVILDIEKIFDEEKLPINKTRFKQKADFYSSTAIVISCSGSSCNSPFAKTKISFCEARLPPRKLTLYSGKPKSNSTFLNNSILESRKVDLTSGGNPCWFSQQHASVLAEYPDLNCSILFTNNSPQFSGPLLGI